MRAALAALGFSLALACGGASARPRLAPADFPLPPTAERAYAVLAPRFDREAAMDIVRFMQQYWRIAGNPGFNASIDEIQRRLLSTGFGAAGRSGPTVRINEYPNTARGWDYTRGTVTIDGTDAPVLSRDRDRVSLAINSFSTAQGGRRARLVDVGRGAVDDFSGKDIKGAVVLGDAPLGALWREAVRNRGAAGVISTEIARYIRPADPSVLSEEQRDVLQWGSVPYDDKLKAFGFRASARAAETLREGLRRNPAMQVRVKIESTFYDGPVRSLVAEIPGRTLPNERIVIVAHVQEPGANDNASGCGTLFSMAKSLAQAVARGLLPPPDRTLTFMWVDEIRGSRQWIAANPAAARDVRYMFSMDMTGQDTAKTGGTFLIEKQADPSAVWPRPSDPHSEWGAGEVKHETLKGSLLNDVHLAVAHRRARDTAWVVRTNPYEGGSDHTVFASAGVPSLLNWHFTDRYYHTNQDTIDKVSAREMENVGVTVATSAYFLAAAHDRDALEVVDLVERAATARLTLERRQGPAIVAAAKDPAAAERTEAQVIAAWIRWYGEALDSIATLQTGRPDSRLMARISAAKEKLK